MGTDAGTTTTEIAGTVDSGSASGDGSTVGADSGSESSTTGTVNAACLVQDGFDGPTLDERWDLFEDGAVTLAVGGELRIDVPAFVDGEYAGVLLDDIDMSERYVRARVLEPPPPETTLQLFLGVRQSAEDGAARYDIYVRGESLTVVYRDTAGEVENLMTVPQSPGDIVWLQTRLDAGDIVFERSADAVVWEEFFRTTSALTLTQATIALVGGAHASDPTMAAIRIDDVAICDNVE